jgi:arylsulfatase A
MRSTLAILAALTFLTNSPIKAESARKPNVIFILADDLGIGNLSCYGADNYQSPNIDKLAATGMRFTRSFTASLCGPSRALIMTGRYAFRNGSTNQDACMQLPNSELQLARIFKSAQYTTAYIGKWGQLPGEPDEAGFDDYLRFQGSGVYWNDQPGKPEAYRNNGKELKLGENEYMPHIMHDRVTMFLRANQTKPFFLFYSLAHVHGEIRPTPDSSPDSKDLFGDNIRYMDKLVGKLINELDELKLRDKTLIIFMGDNGTGKGQHPRSTIGGRNLSGMKGSMLEGGGLVPTIVNWPGKVPSGMVSANLMDSTDLIPTFAEIVGVTLPKERVFDGISFAQQLLGKPGPKREWIYNQLASMWYVREENWKLNEKGELFDMSDAPFAEKLISESNDTEATKAARTRLAAALAKLNPAGGILDQGDGTGRHANKNKKNSNSTKSTTEEPTSPNADSLKKADALTIERSAKFDRLDKEKVGKFTLDFYVANQSDPSAATERFKRMDTNADGFVTREEYLLNGNKK